jgi:hypothetical protein
MSPRRAEASIQRLRAKLETSVSLRLKPVLWGKTERRSRLEAALKRTEYVVWRKLARMNPNGK